MKSWSLRDLRRRPFWVYRFHAGLAALMIFLISLSAAQGPLEIQLASANSHLGILGRPAPELNLDNWIDADGNRMEPIRLGDFRGKVVYLYFFQDW